MIYGTGRGPQPGSDQIPKLIGLSKNAGAGVYFGKSLNRYSNVHIDGLVNLYLLLMEEAQSDPSSLPGMAAIRPRKLLR
jgi:hypothetical protein